MKRRMLLKRIAFLLFGLLLLPLIACGGNDITTTTAVTTTIVTTTQGNVIQITPGQGVVSTPEFQREQWRVTLTMLEQSDTQIKLSLHDEDKIGFWQVTDSLRFERQKEDGSWELLASDTHAIGSSYPLVTMVQQTTSCTLIMPLRESWGTPLAAGTYRFTKNVYNDNRCTDGNAVVLEFTVA